MCSNWVDFDIQVNIATDDALGPSVTRPSPNEMWGFIFVVWNYNTLHHSSVIVLGTHNWLLLKSLEFTWLVGGFKSKNAWVALSIHHISIKNTDSSCFKINFKVDNIHKKCHPIQNIKNGQFLGLLDFTLNCVEIRWSVIIQMANEITPQLTSILDLCHKRSMTQSFDGAIIASINCWTNSRFASELRHHDVTVMTSTCRMNFRGLTKFCAKTSIGIGLKCFLNIDYYHAINTILS